MVQRPIGRAALINALRGFNPSPVVNPTQVPATAVMRLQDARQRQAQDMARFERPVPSSGPLNAALIGVLNGIAKHKARMGHEARIEDAYQAYEASERAKTDAERKRELEDREWARTAQQEDRADAEDAYRARKEWEWASKPVDQLSPQDILQMQQTQAQIAQIMQQMDMRREDNERKNAKERREADEATAVQEEQAATRDLLVDNIDYLLDPENRKAMNRATGSVDSKLPTFRQSTQDWENAFNFVKSGLTSEKLDMMTGVLSESDIMILSQIASGGIDLSSSPERIIPTLGRFRDAYSNSSSPDGSEPQSLSIDDLVSKYGN